MSNPSDLISTNIEAYLAQHERKDMLRFLTCGNVDDGKSTLIGRLLHDTQAIYEDQLAALEKDSKVHGTQGGAIDLALLVDGLKSEREQGITIDVAYRYFSTANRKYIIADTPGHEQYTRNMATGASTAEVAVILIDARKGVTTQTRRHSFITSLLGIKQVVVAVNKMDLVGCTEERFEAIRREYLELANKLPERSYWFIPMSALDGDNVVTRSARMRWYDGPPLLELLDTVPIDVATNLVSFRFPIQYVNRPHADFRGYSGTIASGAVRVGDDVVALPSGRRSRVAQIVCFDGNLSEASAPMSVTLTLEDELDASRGDMLCIAGDRPLVASTTEATLVWMSEQAMVPGKEYIIKHNTHETPGVFTRVIHRVDVNSLERSGAPALSLNEIGRVELRTSRPLLFDPYRVNRGTGAFVVIDRITNGTIGAGMIEESGIGHWEARAPVQSQQAHVTVSPREREARFGQRPTTVLLVGLVGAGKTEIARLVERMLFDRGRTAVVLDGSEMRRGLGRDLGFSASGRSENLRRTMEVAKTLNDAGLVCIASLVAPESDARRRSRELIGAERFMLVHVSAPLEFCKRKDQSGIYRDVEAGRIADVPGVSFPFEAPEDADLILPSHELEPAECASRIVQELSRRGRLG